MTEATLTVPTAFVDISQLAEGLADRVDEGRLMLYGPSSYTEGEWIRFEVLLADESAALEGVGRVVASIDGGEERPDVARWDVVLDNLQLEGMGEVVYERILMVRGGAFGDEHATGEVSLDDVEQVETEAVTPGIGDEFVDEATSVAEHEDYRQHVEASAAPEDHAASEYGQPMGFDEGDETAVSTDDGDDDYASGMAEASDAVPEEPVAMEAGFQDAGWAEGADEVAGDEVAADDWDRPISVAPVEVHEDEVAELDAGYEVPASAPPPPPPQAPGGFQIAAVSEAGALARPSRGASWYPEVVPPPDPRPSSGLFGFAGGLPIPHRPPRPDLDPSMRVQPAPRPQNGQAEPDEHLQYSPPVHAHDATDPSFAAPEHDGDFDSLEQPIDYGSPAYDPDEPQLEPDED